MLASRVQCSPMIYMQGYGGGWRCPRSRFIDMERNSQRAGTPQTLRQRKCDVWIPGNSLWVLALSVKKCRSLSTKCIRTLALMYVSICLYLAHAPQGSRELSENTWTRLGLNPFLSYRGVSLLLSVFLIYIFRWTLKAIYRSWPLFLLPVLNFFFFLVCVKIATELDTPDASYTKCIITRVLN